MTKEIEAACKLLAELQERLYQTAESGNTSDGMLIAAHELMHISYIIGKYNDDLKGARNIAKLHATEDKIDWGNITKTQQLSDKYLNGSLAMSTQNKDIAMIFDDDDEGYDYEIYDEFFDEVAFVDSNCKEDVCTTDDNIYASPKQIPLSKQNQEDMLGFPRIHTHVKPICKECNGKGILDFGFYTRKCMKCSQE